MKTLRILSPYPVKPGSSFLARQSRDRRLRKGAGRPSRLFQSAALWARSGSILTVALVVSANAADDLPKRYNFDRYKAMLDKSPFAVATAVAAPVEAASFAKDLYLANAAHSDEGDMVTIASLSDKGFKKYLTTKEPVDGYAIASIEWSEIPGKTKVTITKDGKAATLGFNQALLTQPIASAPGTQPMPGGVPAPGQQHPPGTFATPMPPSPAAPNVVRPAQMPTLPTPQPHVRGVIQKSGGVVRPTPSAVPKITPEDSDEEEEE